MIMTSKQSGDFQIFKCRGAKQFFTVPALLAEFVSA